MGPPTSPLLQGLIFQEIIPRVLVAGGPFGGIVGILLNLKIAIPSVPLMPSPKRLDASSLALAGGAQSPGRGGLRL